MGKLPLKNKKKSLRFIAMHSANEQTGHLSFVGEALYCGAIENCRIFGN